MAEVLRMEDVMMGSRNNKSNNKNPLTLYSVISLLVNVESQSDTHAGSNTQEFKAMEVGKVLLF